VSTDIPPAEDAATVKPDNQYQDIAPELPVDPEVADTPAHKPSAPHAVAPDNVYTESAPEAAAPDNIYTDSAPED
jgi:hypothetical protein